MKIYTKTGDAGHTTLVGGKKRLKNDVRLHAYGAVDELNSALGVVIALGVTQKNEKQLTEIQNKLFYIGSELATVDQEKIITDGITEEDIKNLEDWMDDMDKDLPPLRHFILPGGVIQGAHTHLARTVCRRAERQITGLLVEQEIRPIIFQYLNRLSDYLFILARSINHRHQVEETQWIPNA